MQSRTYQSEPLDFQQILYLFKETDKKFKETDKKLNKLEDLFTTQWGKLVESLVEGKIVELLRQKGIDIQRTHTRIKNYDKKIEVDILACNGEDVVIVEVKTTLNIKKVNEFIKKMKMVRELFPEYKDKRIYGAVAYLIASESAEIYSEKKGFFVIRATGDSASIINSESFTPKKW